MGTFTYVRHRIRRTRPILRHPAFRLILLFLLVLDTLHIAHIHSAQTSARSPSRPPPPPLPPNTRIFIASQHWNTARILRDRWNAALLELVQHLGTDNVFVSIFESGSYDKTKDALRELDAELEKLGVRRNIDMSDVSHKDEIARAEEVGEGEEGWIRIPDGKMALRRIPFLARLRNRVLGNLEELVRDKGERFDYVLFLNDVAFTPADVLTLFHTNDAHYAAACSLDFSRTPHAYYDTFALRDSQGHETVSQYWPYFRSSASRRAVQKFEPVPVSSCWNGMVIMPVGPFLGGVFPKPENKEGESVMGKDQEEKKLRFRAIPDTLAQKHLEGSECCLIHADNPLSRTHGIYLNPNVLVSYNSTVYDQLHSANALMSPFTIWKRVWWNRVLRWGTVVWVKEEVVRRRIRTWMSEGRSKGEERREMGEVCLINEMQVLHEKGWRHV